MAQDASLDGLRNQIITSVFGRRLGFDSGGYLMGMTATRSPVQSLTSGSTATAVTFGGIARIALTTATPTWSLGAPVPGTELIIQNDSTGTGGIVSLASGNFLTSASSTQTQVTVGGKGSRIRVLGLTTAFAQVLANWPEVVTAVLSSASSTSTTVTVTPASTFA